MRKHVLLFLIRLAATSATAREHPARWIEVRSSGFTIFTNSSEKQGRRIAAQFEHMRAIFQEAYPQLEDDSDTPVFVLAIKSKDQFRALEPRDYQASKSLPLHGMFVRAADKNYILMRLDAEAGSPYPVVYHEYTHLFLGQSDKRIPLWLNEGLAEFYQTIEIYDQDVLLGEPNEQHLMLLRQEKLVPLAALFGVDEKSPYYLEEKKGSIFYAECWALTHYLTLKDYAEKTSKVQRYTRLVNNNVDPVIAATRVFGDLRQLQRSLDLYVEQRTFNHFETRIPTEANDSDFQVRSMTSQEAQAVKADYLVASGRPEEARALLPSGRQNDAEIAEDQTPADNSRRIELNEDMPCPLSQILHGASERATEMVENLQRFTATEEIAHTEFKKNGKARKASHELYSYVAEIAQGPSGAFWVEEYRSSASETNSPALADTGTAAFALIFHPKKIGNFEFHCERLTNLRDGLAWQLRFEESPDPSKSFHQIRIDRSVYQLRFRGHAWIAASDYQILRLQTDLVEPLPQIRLQLEHLDITYAPAEFEKRQFRIWLPDTASMQISYRGRRNERVHKFRKFQLFLIVTEQTVKEPKAGPGG